MRSVDVAIGVEQHRGGGACGLQRSDEFWIGPTEVVQQPCGAAQLARDVHADVRGGGKPPVAVRAKWAELGGPRQRRDASHAVTSGTNALRRPFEQGGDLFVGLDRRLGEMPRAPVRLIGPQLS